MRNSDPYYCAWDFFNSHATILYQASLPSKPVRYVQRLIPRENSLDFLPHNLRAVEIEAQAWYRDGVLNITIAFRGGDTGC